MSILDALNLTLRCNHSVTCYGMSNQTKYFVSVVVLFASFLSCWSGGAFGQTGPQLHIVGERGPELFVPDENGAVVPQYYIPNKSNNLNKGQNNWPKVPATDAPGRYHGLGREMAVQTLDAERPDYGPGGLLELMRLAPLRINPAAWDRFLR